MHDRHGPVCHHVYDTATGTENVTPTSNQGPGGSALVSVGLPTYNRLTSLRRAVDSVLGQEQASIELVVCDNASTDGTEEYGRALAERHASVRYLRNEENVGPTENFNRARAAATGRYFMWLGDDDWLDPSYISRCVDVLERDPQVALAAGEARYYEDDRFVRTGARVALRSPNPFARVLGYYRKVSDNGTFYGVMRAAAIDQVPAMQNRMGDDWYLVAAVAFQGTVEHVDGVAVHRDLGGATRSLANVARQAGHSRIEREWPQLAIAGWAARDIGFESPVYRALGRFRRIVLGGLCGFVVIARFIPKKAPKYLRLKWGQLMGESHSMAKERSA
jgi:glycosyltransferase involved in cell wall biosynthesis